MMEDVKPRITELGAEAEEGFAGADEVQPARDSQDVVVGDGHAARENGGPMDVPIEELYELNLVEGYEQGFSPSRLPEDLAGQSDGPVEPVMDLLADVEPSASSVQVNGVALATSVQDGATVDPANQLEGMEQMTASKGEAIRSSSEDQVEVKVEEALFEAPTSAGHEASPLPDAIGPISAIVTEPTAIDDASAPTSNHAQSVLPPSDELNPATSAFIMDTSPGLDPADLEALALAATSDSPPPPPPPPLRTASDSLEHVDVDLGPLKSVSRNHAKINYLTDLGHFCLEIYGRNGAWVDDRYFVRGSIVPLNQG